MKLLLDTHVLLCALIAPERLRDGLRRALADRAHDVLFSAASIWEIAIKRALGRTGFAFEPADIATTALRVPFDELPVRAEHAAAVRSLPALHADPFDRMLIAQAIVEGAMLVSEDKVIARYQAPLRAPSEF